MLLFLLIGKSNIWSQPPCPTDITISGEYSTVLTQSNSWIKTAGITTIPIGADVTLDANPLNNGYVFLDVGFSTVTGAVFLAEVETGCVILSLNQNKINNSLTIYPNPTNGFIKIKSFVNIQNISLYDLNGRILKKINNSNSNEETIDLSSFSDGVYLLEVQTELGKTINKIVKK